jgi:membrane protein DedA with SNARE-associated domain
MDSIRAYGALSVFIGVIIESVIVPIPSPLIIMGAGFLLIDAELRFTDALMPILAMIVAPGAIASTLGAYIGYAIGYFGGKPLVEKWKGFLGFSWSDVEAMEQRFRAGQVNTTIFFLRALPIFPLSVISAGAGLLRLPIRQFSVWTFLGTIPRCLFLGYLGWGLGETYQGIAAGLNQAETVISGLLILAAGAGILWLRARVREKMVNPSVD